MSRHFDIAYTAVACSCSLAIILEADWPLWTSEDSLTACDMSARPTLEITFIFQLNFATCTSHFTGTVPRTWWHDGEPAWLRHSCPDRWFARCRKSRSGPACLAGGDLPSGHIWPSAGRRSNRHELAANRHQIVETSLCAAWGDLKPITFREEQRKQRKNTKRALTKRKLGHQWRHYLTHAHTVLHRRVERRVFRR